MSQFDANNIYDVVAIDKDGYHEHVIDKYNNAKDLTILNVKFVDYVPDPGIFGVTLIGYRKNIDDIARYALSNEMMNISDINTGFTTINPNYSTGCRCLILGTLESGNYRIHVLITDKNKTPKAYGSVDFVIS